MPAHTPRHSLPRMTGLLLGAAMVLLTGCASVYRLDNDVRSYANWAGTATPQAGDTYRFERLPSQNTGQAAKEQEHIEQLARTALGKVGLTLTPEASSSASPTVRWHIQVSARSVKMPHAPWERPEPWPGFGLAGRDYVVTGKGQVIWTPMMMRIPSPYYQREVALLVREAGNGQVVYETRAAHDGPWHDSPAMWSALLDAALQGFPRPPVGARRVVIEIPR